MKSRCIGVAATALLVAGPAWAGHDRQDAGKQRAATLAASARAALGQGDVIKAVRDAEGAVLLLPRDAGTRLLLGRSYLAAGRFASADEALQDALTLDSTLGKAAISRALAQIALGQDRAARASLALAEGQVSEADLGLAFALLGDLDQAIARLDVAARADGADGRARQNLALAYALGGRWTEAAAVAKQDVPPDMMPQRLRRWATIAQLVTDPAMRVGAVLGVFPAADDGQPRALALAPAEAAPEPPVLLAAGSPQTAAPIMTAAPVARSESGATVTAVSVTPARLEALAALPDGGATQVPIGLVTRPAALKPRVSAWAGPPRMRKSRIRTPEAPRPVAMFPRPSSSAGLLLASRLLVKSAPPKAGGGWAVQLGAYSSAGRTEIAWSKLRARVTFLNAYTPTGSSRRWGKAMLYRLSVSGLPTRANAISLCVRIKAHGGACFVRNMRGDRPMTWALRGRTERPA